MPSTLRAQTVRTMVRKRTIARYILLTFTAFNDRYKVEHRVFCVM
jgi:hypothetical protein